MTKRHLYAAVSLTVTVIFLAVALRNVPLSLTWQTLETAQWRWVGVMAIVAFLDVIIRALRWRMLLKPAAEVPTALLFRWEAVGMAVNNILFFRLGEFARAFLAAEELDISFMTALSSIVIERAFDIAALLAFFCAAGYLTPGLAPTTILRLALAALAVGLIGLWVLAWAENLTDKSAAYRRFLERFPRLGPLVDHAALGAKALKSPVSAFGVVSASAILWAVDTVGYWACARALGLGGVMDYARSVLVISWGGAAASLPAAPGSFGTLEASIKQALLGLGVSPDKALAYAVLNHMVSYVIVTVLGLAFIYREGLAIGEISEKFGRRNPHPNPLPQAGEGTKIPPLPGGRGQGEGDEESR
jgi:uncharacterized protein (TIRG00374 family)